MCRTDLRDIMLVKTVNNQSGKQIGLVKHWTKGVPVDDNWSNPLPVQLAVPVHGV